ncbi:Uncharacterised protein [Actinomyces bovis]|uniref:DUF8175 domain-containing protein n=1 Tax=Actinomyces bovis TaxID=1658 RepID=A0ABY1VNZ5_9ACTO|nr:hypothetical protein [Actinomyces bovis]SPT53467.1 Uncharacterised protein [Actinomyces bovis]VEG55334.1 Uncharacterised protein [Actinomyces israelii]
MPQEEPNLFNKSFALSAGFIFLLVIGLVWLLVDGGVSRTTVPSGAVSDSGVQAPEVTPTNGVDTPDLGCKMPQGDQKVPTGALGAEVIQVGSDLVVPFVPGAGPGVREGITRCFTHSPTGAVVAATNFLKWLSSNRKLDEVTAKLIAPGPDRDRMLKDVKTNWDGSTTPALTVLGYKTEIRGRDEVLVTLATALPSDLSHMVSWQLVMTWAEDDWKVRPSPTGDWGGRVIKSLADERFAAWTV